MRFLVLLFPAILVAFAMRHLGQLEENGSTTSRAVYTRSAQLESGAAPAPPGGSVSPATPEQPVRREVRTLPAGDSVAKALNEDFFDVASCAAACNDLVVSWSAPMYVSRDQPQGLTLVYNSRTAYVAPIVFLDATPGTGDSELPTRLTYRLIVEGDTVSQIDGGTRKEVYFSYPNNTARPTVRLAFQFDGNSRATGVYNYKALINGFALPARGPIPCWGGS